MTDNPNCLLSHQVSLEETAELPLVSDLSMVEMLRWQVHNVIPIPCSASHSPLPKLHVCSCCKRPQAAQKGMSSISFVILKFSLK